MRQSLRFTFLPEGLPFWWYMVVRDFNAESISVVTAPLSLAEPNTVDTNPPIRLMNGLRDVG